MTRPSLNLLCLLALLLAGFVAAPLRADDPSPPAEAPAATDSASEPQEGDDADAVANTNADTELSDAVRRIADAARPSLATITQTGRDGRQQGMGTGFVISSDGLIATNLHVVGEARPVSVQLADGRNFRVTEVYAWDRFLDLAVLRVDASDLVPLELGDSAEKVVGDPVVVMGNPRGLRYSVVSGVVSGRREIDGRQMLQLAIPIEPGNSGGPVLDRNGRVLGLVTMKSAVTDNLGFAVEINELKPLIAKPNTVAIDRWLTIGVIDTRQWDVLYGARWQQRGGTIVADEPGEGFGGRAACLWRGDLPELPFELAVNVRMEDESGAAGLVFHCDGGDKHYGFYPSAGKLRLSRFEGPDVLTWTVLADVESPHYRPGQWNHLKVRLAEGSIRCYVNDELVIESADDVLPAGRVGLARFRDTKASFKGFTVAKEIGPSQPDAELLASLAAAVDGLPSLAELLPDAVAPLAENETEARLVLRRRADELEARAGEMRLMATDLHTRSVAAQLADLLSGEEEAIDLARAALMVAWLDDEELQIDAYPEQLDRMAAEVAERLPDDADDAARLAALNDYLFRENGYHGSHLDYYHRANSYLNRVIDEREGIPITLSVLYMELGHRIGLKIEGVGLPGHFVVRHVPREGEPQLIDVFEGGKPMTRDEADEKVRSITGQPLTDAHLQAARKRDIVLRMIQNLMGIAQRSGDSEAMLRYLEAVVEIEPSAVRERGMRAVLRFQTGRKQGAVADLDHLIDAKPEGLDLEQVRQMREYFQNSGR